VSGTDNGHVEAAAARLRAKGYRLVRLPPRSKAPSGKDLLGWNTGPDPLYLFEPDSNIGVCTGPALGGPVVVISNDAASTEQFLGLFGPPTEWSLRGAHWWFRGPPGTASIPLTLEDIDRSKEGS
jgi:hypothetical protein